MLVCYTRFAAVDLWAIVHCNQSFYDKAGVIMTGNLLRMPDGQLSYLDFGMMGEIGQETRQALIRATLHLVNGELHTASFVELMLHP